MTIFSYRATTQDGILSEGVIEATDEKAVIQRLKSTGVIPLEVKAPREGSFRATIRFHLDKIDIVSFTSELSSLLTAGLPLDRALQVLVDISEQRALREIVQSLLKSIRGGMSFSEALQKHPQVFPHLYINMVRAGEAGGILDAILERLNEFLESTKELKDHVISAMIYPAILAATGGVSIILLLTFVLPRFSTIFAELGSSLPLPTLILLSVSGILQSYGWVFLILLGGAVFLFRNYIGTAHGRYRWDGLKLRLMGDVIKKLETARFCRTLGTLLNGGVPLLQALNNARDVIGNRVMAAAIEGVVKGAKEGRGVSEPLSRSGVFPSLAISMVKVGEETGTLDQMLIQVALIYEKNLKQAVKRFMSILEPVMILAMGLIIGFIVISMLLAVFSISDIPV